MKVVVGMRERLGHYPGLVLAVVCLLIGLKLRIGSSFDPSRSLDKRVTALLRRLRLLVVVLVVIHLLLVFLVEGLASEILIPAPLSRREVFIGVGALVGV